MWTVSVLSLGAAVAVSLSVELLCRFLHRSKRSRTLNEVLFFPSKVACMEHVFSPASPHSSHCPLPHGVETSFSRLLRFILAVLELHRRRVTVRILVDKHYSVITGSQIGALRNAGICVHNVGRYVHMHHKFAVVDNRLLITGSLNWTLAAVQSNSENIIITEEPALVRPFMREFSRLWADNDPSQNAPLTGQTLDCID
ncbi:mitochondrial cardiolipin hydrolase isoform X2 [Nerophis lumbriciformis]|uniref:mitochondrial cardiolipin hydrolase isoform X2 n=1 Tax=Nerophis lumbriciformis TaxID=546530 RepID=UPI002ADFA80A|nr:mitochondrial cardiolipin hydrolase-like isoform X2 [Nerophis lumbriciformis]